MARFHLPDLGEGLQEAEIVRWHVAVGDRIAVDQPMVAVETAKAVVEVPSPFAGVITALHGKPGDTVATGAPLVDFSAPIGREAAPAAAGDEHAQGTVVGRMPVSDEVIPAAPPRNGRCAPQRGRARACPPRASWRARLSVDLDALTGSGAGGIVTLDDVLAASPAAVARPSRRTSRSPRVRCGRPRTCPKPARSRCCAACAARWRRA